MPSKDPQKRHVTAKIAANQRWGNSTPDLESERRDLAAQRLEDYVARVVDKAPPLTPEQADRIASLLRPTGGGTA